MCNFEALVSYSLRSYDNFFLKMVKCQGQKIKYQQKIVLQGILVWNIKALALTVQKLFKRLMFLKNKSNSKFKVTILKNIRTHWKTLPQQIFMWNKKKT